MFWMSTTLLTMARNGQVSSGFWRNETTEAKHFTANELECENYAIETSKSQFRHLKFKFQNSSFKNTSLFA